MVAGAIRKGAVKGCVVREVVVGVEEVGTVQYES